jgi:hypothetical protein
VLPSLVLTIIPPRAASHVAKRADLISEYGAIFFAISSGMGGIPSFTIDGGTGTSSAGAAARTIEAGRIATRAAAQRMAKGAARARAFPVFIFSSLMPL